MTEQQWNNRWHFIGDALGEAIIRSFLCKTTQHLRARGGRVHRVARRAEEEEEEEVGGWVKRLFTMKMEGARSENNVERKTWEVFFFPFLFSFCLVSVYLHN